MGYFLLIVRLLILQAVWCYLKVDLGAAKRITANTRATH